MVLARGGRRDHAIAEAFAQDFDEARRDDSAPALHRMNGIHSMFLVVADAALTATRLPRGRSTARMTRYYRIQAALPIRAFADCDATSRRLRTALARRSRTATDSSQSIQPSVMLWP